MFSLRVVPVTFRHIQFFCEHIRPEDIAECLITHGDNPFDLTINEWVKAGTMALVNDNDEVFALGGVHDNQLWLLGTTLIAQNRMAFLRFTKKLILEDLLDANDYLYNVTWKVNSDHLKWLKWLGCEVVDENDDFALFLFRKEGVDIV